MGNLYPGHLELGLAAGLLILGLMFILILTEKRPFGFLIFFSISFGYLSLQPWVSPRFNEDHIVHRADTGLYFIVGVVDSEPKESEDQAVLIINSVCLRSESDNRQSFQAVEGKIRVTVRWDKKSPVEVRSGDTVSLTSRIRLPRNFNNPGSFDYKRYLAFEGIWATAYITPEHLTVLAESCGYQRIFPVETLRKEISDRIDQVRVSEHMDAVKGVLKALIIGYRSEIPPSLREAFNRSGVSHLLAISGLHMGIVAGASFFIFSRILSLWELLLWHAWTKKGAALLTLFPVLIYGLLSGMSPSTQRAVIMVSVFLISILFLKEQDIMNTLAFAALIILIIHPPALFSISFQLSFFAVFFIIYGLSKIKRLQPRENRMDQTGFWSRVRTGFFSFFLVSIFATLGTLPLILYYFNLLSLISPIANMIIVPVIGFLVVPLGLLSVLIFPIAESLSALMLSGAGWILSKGIDIVFFFSNWRFAAIKTISFSFFEMSCFYLGVLSIFEIKRSGTFSIMEKHPCPMRSSDFLQKAGSILTRPFPVKSLVSAVFLTAFLGISIDALYWIHHRLWHKDLRITVMDVGKGNALLMELPKGRNILIDGGGVADNSIFDVGEKIVAPFLWKKKIISFDAVILSHPNSDHMNGLIHIFKHFQVKEVWTNGEEADTFAYRKFIQAIRDAEIVMPNFEDLSRLQQINGVKLEILYPPCDYTEKRTKEKWRRDNDNSFVIKADFGSHTFLFPGDITGKAEKDLVEEWGENLKSQILISPHHGSKTSNTDLFLDAVDPQYVIFSAGGKGPHPAVLTRYYKRGVQLFSTHIHGGVSIISDGAHIDVKTVKNERLI
jgi:competence protein ComEC